MFLELVSRDTKVYCRPCFHMSPSRGSIDAAHARECDVQPGVTVANVGISDIYNNHEMGTPQGKVTQMWKTIGLVYTDLQKGA